MAKESALAAPARAQTTLSLSRCTLSGNFHAGLSAKGASAHPVIDLTQCVLADNRGNGLESDFQSGSGVALGLVESTLSGNVGSGVYHFVYRSSIDLSILGCTLNGNARSGIFADGDTGASRMTLTNCTLSENSTDARGGAIYSGTFIWTSSLKLNNCTISGNSASISGGGIYTTSGTTLLPTLDNTIVAQNSAPAGPDLSGAFNPISSHNLVGVLDAEVAGITPSSKGNLTGTLAAPLDPRLAPLADNGGATQTMALLGASPAINAGDNLLVPPGVTTDQRGRPRVQGSFVDIGAFERWIVAAHSWSPHRLITSQIEYFVPAPRWPFARSGELAITVLS